jgi:hypothetical protein
MSIIGIASTNTTVTENFIVRNTSIRKENLHMIDSVAAEAYQRVSDVEYVDPLDVNAFLTVDEIDPAMPSHFHWVLDKDVWRTSGNLARWYNRNTVGPVLVPANSEVPESIINNDLTVIDNRNEYDGTLDNSPIRYALVGWDLITEGGESIVENQPGALTVKKANILVEYLSQDYGVIRLIVGIKKEFST